MPSSSVGPIHNPRQLSPTQHGPAFPCCAGVQGIGSEDSPLALYEDADGDRGILADQVCGLLTLLLPAWQQSSPTRLAQQLTRCACCPILLAGHRSRGCAGAGAAAAGHHRRDVRGGAAARGGTGVVGVGLGWLQGLPSLCVAVAGCALKMTGVPGNCPAGASAGLGVRDSCCDDRRLRGWPACLSAPAGHPVAGPPGGQAAAGAAEGARLTLVPLPAGGVLFCLRLSAGVRMC